MINSEIIASFIVRIPDEIRNEIEAGLFSIQSVEIHGYEKGKMIITIIASDDKGLYHQYNLVKRVRGVLSVELVFSSFTNGGPGREMVKGEMPDWLNSDIDAKQITYNGRIPKYFS